MPSYSSPVALNLKNKPSSFQHYPGTDTLVIWQHYEGIYGEDNEHGLSETEREQLHSVVNGERTFFFANWIFEYNAQSIDQFIKEDEAVSNRYGLKKGFDAAQTRAKFFKDRDIHYLKK